MRRIRQLISLLMRRLRKSTPLFLNIFLVYACFGQTISFSPQGAESLKSLTGQTIKGVQIVEVTTCSQGAPFGISGGDIVQAAVRGGLSPISSKIVPVITNKAVRRSLPSILLTVGTELALELPVLQVSGLIRIGTQVATGLLLAHQLADQAKPFVQSRVPDPTPLLTALIDPTTSYKVPETGQGCVTGFLVARYTGPSKAFQEVLGGHVGTIPNITLTDIQELPEWHIRLHQGGTDLKDTKNGPGVLGL